MRRAPRASARRASSRVITAGVWAAWVVFGLYVVQANLPANVVSLPFAESLRMRTFVPEGWAFFTKTPRDPALLVYDRASGRALNAPLLSERPLLNVTRLARAQGVELGLIMGAVHNATWAPCVAALQDCFSEAQGPPTRVRNSATVKSVCGEVWLVQRRRLPWSYRQLKPEDMPSLILPLSVAC